MNTIKIDPRWALMYVRDAEIEEAALKNMTESERIGYLAVKASLSNL